MSKKSLHICWTTHYRRASLTPTEASHCTFIHFPTEDKLTIPSALPTPPLPTPPPPQHPNPTHHPDRVNTSPSAATSSTTTILTSSPSTPPACTSDVKIPLSQLTKSSQTAAPHHKNPTSSLRSQPSTQTTTSAMTHMTSKTSAHRWTPPRPTATQTPICRIKTRRLCSARGL